MLSLTQFFALNFWSASDDAHLINFTDEEHEVNKNLYHSRQWFNLH